MTDGLKKIFSNRDDKEIIETVRKGQPRNVYQQVMQIPLQQEKQQSPTKIGEMGELMSERTSRRRSISKEKREINSYRELHMMKKNWTENSNEMWMNTRKMSAAQQNEEIEKEILMNYFSAPSNKNSDMNDTIKVHEIISKWKNQL